MELNPENFADEMLRVEALMNKSKNPTDNMVTITGNKKPDTAVSIPNGVVRIHHKKSSRSSAVPSVVIHNNGHKSIRQTVSDLLKVRSTFGHHNNVPGVYTQLHDGTIIEVKDFESLPQIRVKDKSKAKHS